MAYPKVYGFCDAGCKRRVPTYEEFEKSASYIEIPIDEEGSAQIEFGKTYKIFPRTNDQYEYEAVFSLHVENFNTDGSSGETDYDFENFFSIKIDEEIYGYREYYSDNHIVVVAGAPFYVPFEGNSQGNIHIPFKSHTMLTTDAGFDASIETDFHATIAKYTLFVKNVEKVYAYNEDAEIVCRGEDGADGKSAYQIAVEKGFEGTEEEWLASLKGGGSVELANTLEGNEEDKAPSVKAVKNGIEVCAIQKPVEERNVLDEIVIFEDVYVNTNGSQVSSSSYVATDFIRVPAGSSLAINGSVRYLTAYDENKDVISDECISADAPNIVFTAPEDADRYVRLSFRRSSIRAMVTRTTAPQAYVPKDVYITDCEKQYTKKTNSNLLKYLRIFDGYTVNESGNISVNAQYAITDYIKVKAGESIAFTGDYRYFVAYDENKTFISGSYHTPIKSDFVFTAPEDAGRYVRVCFPLSSTQNHMITRTSEVLPFAEYEDVFEDGVLLNDKQLEQVKVTTPYEYKNMLTGKKWYACGDSFTADGYGTPDQPKFTDGIYAGMKKVYPYFIGNRCGVDVYNIAAGGKTLAYVEGYNNCFADTQYKTIPDDADYITMYFGINDAHQSVPIGTADDTNKTTFCGAWNVVLEYLITNHPFAHIGIIVSNGTTADYVEATKQMAIKWGIPFLDLATDDQVPLLLRTNRGNVCSEAKNLRLSAFRVSDTNSHPNAECHEYESGFIESWLMRI